MDIKYNDKRANRDLQKKKHKSTFATKTKPSRFADLFTATLSLDWMNSSCMATCISTLGPSGVE